MPPMASGPVKVKNNRALPLKTVLVDDAGMEITNTDITALPVLQVLYSSSTGGDPVDVSDEALAAGEGTDGNQFEYNEEGFWQFNLKTKNFSSAGTYTILVVSGDESEYIIGQTYTPAEFVVK